MAGLQRVLSGIGVNPPRSMLENLPAMLSKRQAVLQNDFLPYRAGDFTLTQTNGAAAAFSWNLGAVQLSTTGGTAGDRVFLALPTLSWQVIGGNQLFFDTKLAFRSTITDVNMFSGLFDTADPNTAANGLYFLKPAGGTAVNFVIKKAGVTTTFQNIGDIGRPSGIFNDLNSVAGTLQGTIAGGILTAVSVLTPGSGYQSAPIVVHTTAAGTLGTVYVQIGSSALGVSSFALANLTSTQLPYGALYSPVVTNGGSGYTNGAASFDVCTLHDLMIAFDAKGRLLVGINDRIVMSVGGSAVETAPISFAPGATINVATSASPNFGTAGTQLSTSIAPVQPPLGSAQNVVPLVPMEWVTGYGNTTANPRAMFVDEFTVVGELN